MGTSASTKSGKAAAAPIAARPTEDTDLIRRLLAMSNEEFDAWVTKNPAKAALMRSEPPRKRG